jgi:hypothetical protein
MDELYFQVLRVKQKEEECASAALLQVLKYFGDTKTSLEDIIDYCGEHFKFRDWDYLLGCFALDNDYSARVHSRSLSIFDSTWYDLDVDSLIQKLKKQREYTQGLEETFYGYKKLHLEVQSAIRFLENGGEIDFSSISKNLIISYLNRKIPVIATFTAQLAYKLPKESDDECDDIGGEPWKHTLVINGFKKNRFYVTDPADFQPEPEYSVNSDTLIDAIIRYDSNLLIINNQRLS